MPESNYYEINVSLNGVHFFATAPRSILTLRQLNEVYAALADRFHEADGYLLNVTYWRTEGTHISPPHIDSK